MVADSRGLRDTLGIVVQILIDETRPQTECMYHGQCGIRQFGEHLEGES